MDLLQVLLQGHLVVLPLLGLFPGSSLAQQAEQEQQVVLLGEPELVLPLGPLMATFLQEIPPVLHGELYLGEQEDSWGDWEVMRVPY